MRRIAVTLAVVALLFSSGVAWAGFDDGMAAYNRGDYATALKEFRPLAEQGLAGAQYYLGLMYDHGYGVPENNTEAVKWFRKAAVQGNSKAQTNLGIMYVLGIGVPKDYVKAHMWFSLAKAEGHEGAAKSLDMVKEEMNTTQIDEAQKLAAEWWEEHND